MAVRTGAGVHLNLPPGPGRRQAGAPAGARPIILRFNQPERHPGGSPNATTGERSGEQARSDVLRRGDPGVVRQDYHLCA